MKKCYSYKTATISVAYLFVHCVAAQAVAPACMAKFLPKMQQTQKALVCQQQKQNQQLKSIKLPVAIVSQTYEIQLSTAFVDKSFTYNSNKLFIHAPISLRGPPSNTAV